VRSAIRLIHQAQDVAVVTDDVRRRILHELATPQSASAVARTLGLPRQRIGYHMRELEKHGFVRSVREERRRGCIERVMERTADQVLLAPDAFAETLDPAAVRSELASNYLIALAAQLIREVSEAQNVSARAGKRLATLSAHVDVRFASQEDKHAFAEEATAALAKLAQKYHQPSARGGRTFRVMIGSYPAPATTKTRKASA
jgi:DNA-binding transcriptional ArsR family regulator